MRTLSSFNNTKKDDISESMYKLLKNANNASSNNEPLDPKSLKNPQEDEKVFPGIVHDRIEALKMLDWMEKNSPVQYAKKEAKAVGDFLRSLNNPQYDRSLIAKNGLVPTLYELDRIATHLCLYRNPNGVPLNHYLMVQDMAMLLTALRDYKYNFAQLSPEETITRWETAIAANKDGKNTNPNPELQMAIKQTINSEQSKQVV